MIRESCVISKSRRWGDINLRQPCIGTPWRVSVSSLLSTPAYETVEHISSNVFVEVDRPIQS